MNFELTDMNNYTPDVVYVHLQHLWGWETETLIIMSKPQFSETQRFVIHSTTLCHCEAWQGIPSPKIYFNLLGNRRVRNRDDIVAELLNSLKEMGCSMSLKIHLLCSQTPSQKIFELTAVNMGDIVTSYFYNGNASLPKWSACPTTNHEIVGSISGT